MKEDTGERRVNKLKVFILQMKEEYGFSVSYPLAELLSCVGFFLLFFVEEIILLVVPGIGHSHGPTSAQIAEGFYER